MEIYQPAEDSYLLQKQVQKLAQGKVLDLGTGSGILALTAAKLTRVKEITAVDINKDALAGLRKKIKKDKLTKIKVLHSNLFEKVKGKFDTIIFNPPYLPQDEGIKDPALYGGKKGWEISEKFLKQVSDYLNPNGKILFLFSTLTNKNKVEQIITKNLLQFHPLSLLKIAFETLYVYKIKKTILLNDLEEKRIKNIRYFAQGKRGVIYTGIKNRKVAIKVKREDSKAVNRIQNEAKWLKVLNKQGIGPQLLLSNDSYLVYQFVEGKFFLSWIKDESKLQIMPVLKNILHQCFIMDQLKVNKKEMHHPLKHIIITKSNKPVLIDFERSTKTKKPQNVTQFVEFICRMKNELKEKKIFINVETLRELAKEYKQAPSQKKFKAIALQLK